MARTALLKLTLIVVLMVTFSVVVYAGSILWRDSMGIESPSEELVSQETAKGGEPKDESPLEEGLTFPDLAISDWRTYRSEKLGYEYLSHLGQNQPHIVEGAHRRRR